MLIILDCAPVTLWICCHGAWLLRHGRLIVYLKIAGKNVLNHFRYVVLFIKLSLMSMWWWDFQNIPWKYPHNLTSHLGFILILEGGCLQNWSSVNKPQGQKVSYRGVEMHHTGGKNPSYHVIIHAPKHFHSMFQTICKHLVGLYFAVVLAQMFNGLYSLSGTAYYWQISGTFGAARSDAIMVILLWHLPGISEAALPRCLSNFKAIGKV